MLKSSETVKDKFYHFYDKAMDGAYAVLERLSRNSFRLPRYVGAAVLTTLAVTGGCSPEVDDSKIFTPVEAACSVDNQEEPHIVKPGDGIMDIMEAIPGVGYSHPEGDTPNNGNGPVGQYQESAMEIVAQRNGIPYGGSEKNNLSYRLTQAGEILVLPRSCVAVPLGSVNGQ